jgi:hypothetical protein
MNVEMFDSPSILFTVYRKNDEDLLANSILVFFFCLGSLLNGSWHRKEDDIFRLKGLFI